VPARIINSPGWIGDSLCGRLVPEWTWRTAEDGAYVRPEPGFWPSRAPTNVGILNSTIPPGA